MNDAGIRMNNKVEGNIEQAKELRRCIKRWPAVILATRRTDNVIGRIKFLVISIKTMTGIRGVGDPVGTIWVNIILVFLIEK